MYVNNITDLNTTNNCDNITDLNTTNNITDNCTDNENNIDIIIPTLLLTIPYVLSFLCLRSLTVYTLSKLLIKIK